MVKQLLLGSSCQVTGQPAVRCNRANPKPRQHGCQSVNSVFACSCHAVVCGAEDISLSPSLHMDNCSAVAARCMYGRRSEGLGLEDHESPCIEGGCEPVSSCLCLSARCVSFCTSLTISTFSFVWLVRCGRSIFSRTSRQAGSHAMNGTPSTKERLA
jgi:hypothetical protein